MPSRFRNPVAAFCHFVDHYKHHARPRGLVCQLDAGMVWPWRFAWYGWYSGLYNPPGRCGVNAGLTTTSRVEPVTLRCVAGPANFLGILTGANMAGKNTFIQSVGVAVSQHLIGSMGCQPKQLPWFSTGCSAISMVNNIAQGESYFAMKLRNVSRPPSADRRRRQKRWLILIDEPFKGTNAGCGNATRHCSDC